jgi:hypothetical protein
MAIKTHLTDSQGTGNGARVTKYGQLVTSPLDYSTTSSNKLEVVNTAYSFVAPMQNKVIIVTDILLYANKNVGAGDATVIVYTSDVGADTTTVKETVLETEMLKQTSRDLTGLNIKLKEGRWLNAKTDDDDVFVTIGYYYAPVLKDED